ncbi:MAG: uridine kinase [Luminiphilus sp.]|jgi:uridine kinase|nr:uridine kinase [Luminiphilus sp.]
MNVVVAIAGGSGSGKSTLAESLLSVLGPERVAVLPIDAYYHDLSQLDSEAREKVNFDHPDALDLALFASHVAGLREGRPVQCPAYEFTTHCRLHYSITVQPQSCIVVEGILVAATQELRALYDELIYVDTDAQVRWPRRLRRDQVERGRDRQSIELFWARAEGTFREWGCRAKDYADLVIRGDQPTEAMVATLLAHVGERLLDLD